MAKKGNKYAGDAGTVYEPSGVASYLGLGRPINFEDPITKSAMICTVVVSVVMTLWKHMNGMEVNDAVVAGVGSALGFLLSFMVAQELDPDRQMGGIIGGGLTLVAFYFLGEGNFLVMLWLLFILRMLTRTSGDRHRIADNVIMIGIAAWLGREGYWAYPMLTGAAYILESQITVGYFRSLYLAGIALACLIFANYSSGDNALHVYYIYLMAATFILFLPELRTASYVQAKGDKNGKRLLPKRLQTAQGFFLMTGFSLALLHGNTQALSMVPAFMAAIGCGVYMVVDLASKVSK